MKDQESALPQNLQPFPLRFYLFDNKRKETRGDLNERGLALLSGRESCLSVVIFNRRQYNVVR